MFKDTLLYYKHNKVKCFWCVTVWGCPLLAKTRFLGPEYKGTRCTSVHQEARDSRHEIWPLNLLFQMRARLLLWLCCGVAMVRSQTINVMELEMKQGFLVWPTNRPQITGDLLIRKTRSSIFNFFFLNSFWRYVMICALALPKNPLALPKKPLRVHI